MRARILVFAFVVAVALALNLARLSLSIAQTGDDTLRARLGTATSSFKGQMEMLDARLSPRAVAAMPDLIEATRAPADPTQPLGNPDEKALRAAATALSPEPDLFAVVNPQGAIVSRRAKAAVTLDDPSRLPMAKTASDGGNPAPVFAVFDGAMYRFAAARVPGNAAAAVVGAVIDDRFAQQLKSQVDADVTLMQGGKVIASSLPQGDERARLLRWAAAPSAGYGVLRVNLPLVGSQLSGRLPRGAARYAVRGALVPLDSGVSAAITLPASPYFAWLARYQAFYVVGLALFILFSLIWALLARPPEPVVQRVEVPAAPEPVSAPRRARREEPALPATGGARTRGALEAAPSLDVGEPTGEPPPQGEVPWTPPIEEKAVPLPPPPAAMESLDPEIPPPPPAGAARPVSPDHPMWASDPFTATPGQFTAAETAEPELVSAEEVGLVEATPSPPPPLSLDPEVEPEKPAQANGDTGKPGDFSFAGLLDEAHAHPAPEQEKPPPLSQDYPDTTAPGRPTEELLAQARGGDSQELPVPEEPAAPAHFPGDEPTRVEAVSAALLDKLRERDDEPAPAPSPQQGWGSLLGDDNERTMETPPPEMPAPEPEPQPEAQPEAEAAPEPPPPDPQTVTMTNFSLADLQETDPDEAHWRETFDKFRELKSQLGEPADKISFEKFAAKLKKNRTDLVAKHNCKGVRFSVYEKEGKAAIKASAIR